MHPNRTRENGTFRAVVPSYGQLEQEVRSLYDEAAFYKKELEDALRLVEKLKKELNHES